MTTRPPRCSRTPSTAAALVGLIFAASAGACVELSGRDELAPDGPGSDARNGVSGPGLEVGGTCFPVCGAGAVDPDGDGWGWENMASCIVQGSPPSVGADSCGDAPPTDGGLQVGGTCFPLCSAGAIDPDGDGWGWENMASCLVAGSPPTQGASPCEPDSPGGGDPPAGDGDPPGGCDAAGFHVAGGKLFDNHCNEFIPRGINYPFAWYDWRGDTAQQFADMANAGANAVRVVLSNGERWGRNSGAQVAQVIQWAVDNEMVAVLEVHDATGWSDQATAAHPQTAVDYWLSGDVLAALDGTEAHVLLNIANEPIGNTTVDQWQSFHVSAIGQLRAAGVSHTLIVDAPNWGQDWTNTMRSGTQAQAIFNADPDANVMFSVHMYDVYGSPSSVTSYIDDFLGSGLPLMVGEFAADHGAGKPVAEEAILAHSELRGIGYLGWSWSGNSSDLASLDITSGFSVGSVTPWGQTLLYGTHGLLATAQTCTCFDAP